MPQQFEGSRVARLLFVEIEEKLDIIMARLTSILGQLDVALSTRASEATLLNVLTELGNILVVLGNILTQLNYLIAYMYPPSSAYFDDDTDPFPDWDALAIAANDITRARATPPCCTLTQSTPIPVFKVAFWTT